MRLRCRWQAAPTASIQLAFAYTVHGNYKSERSVWQAATIMRSYVNSMDTLRMQRNASDSSDSTPQPRDPAYWSAVMSAVAEHRDRVSFMRIYDHFMPRVLSYLTNLGATRALAEDVAQEALLRVWQSADRYDPKQASLCTWLFRIARNLHIDRIRKEPYWVSMQAGLSQVEQNGPAPTSGESYADATLLRRRLEQLPAKQARVLRMSFFEGKSHSEIAAELNMPLGTVKSDLRRAFIKLQVRMRAVS